MLSNWKLQQVVHILTTGL